jgi:hypothetical protein
VTVVGLLERTFQFGPNLGPWRERDLWRRGIRCWAEFQVASAGHTVLSTRLDAELGPCIADAILARSQGDLPRLARLISKRAHWRLIADFQRELLFLDVEADRDGRATVIGVIDGDGAASFRRDVGEFEGLATRLRRRQVWVTFGGSVFDLPLLRRTVTHLEEPAVHVDLRLLAQRVQLRGGLKALEAELGCQRPAHLSGLTGLEAQALWAQWHDRGAGDALRLLIEYNLRDVSGLRVVLLECLRRLARSLARSGAPEGCDASDQELAELADLRRTLEATSLPWSA